MDKETKQEFDKINKNFEEKFDGLAGMVKVGFDGVYKELNNRFEQVDTRFDAVDKRFDGIDNRLDGIESEIRQIRVEINQIWNKLEEIEKKLERISQTSKEDVNAISGDVLDLKQRVEFLEKQVKKFQNA
ncbi:hypothetical protein KKA69_05105 [Patescibacteria group bacterium]|nr:hypothetical protein [Patescibacteria group bacterium]